MKLFDSEDDLTAFNKHIDGVCSNFKSVNFIKLICSKVGDHKISVIGKYVKDLPYLDYSDVCAGRVHGKTVTLSGAGGYHGLRPDTDLSQIGKLIYGSVFADTANLKKYMANHADRFALEDLSDNIEGPQAFEFLECLYAATLTRVAFRFGYHINLFGCLEGKTKKDFQDKFDEIEKTINNKQLSKMFLITDELDDGILKIRGRPSTDFMKDFRYEIKYDANKNVLYLDKGAEHSNLNVLYVPECDSLLGKGKSVSDLIALVDGDEYYSGVIPSLRKIDVNHSNSYNAKTDVITLTFSKTVFALEDTIDNPWIVDLPVLFDFKTKLENYFDAENKLEEKYVFAENKGGSLVESINRYLKQSLNTRVIGISGNIITSDGYLLYGLRGKHSVDTSSLYCSVNGQSEIIDSKVGFYSMSSYEDYPTIQPDSEFRVDFGKEFARETYAELSIPGFDVDYEIYGISVLGLNQEKWQNANKNERCRIRRLHFNILAVHHTSRNIREIHKHWKQSTEAFENRDILAIRHVFYPSRLDRFNSSLPYVSRFMSSAKLIESLTFAALSFFLFFNIKDTYGNLKNAFDIALFSISLLCLLILVISSVKSYVFEKKHSRINRTTLKKGIQLVDDNLLTAVRKKDLSKLNSMACDDVSKKSTKSNEIFFAPIGLIMECLYICSESREALDKKSTKHSRKIRVPKKRV